MYSQSLTTPRLTMWTTPLTCGAVATGAVLAAGAQPTTRAAKAAGAASASALELPQFSKGVSVVAGDRGHGRAAEVRTVMVGPDPLLVSLDEHAVGARAPGLDPPISLQRSEDTRSLGHARTVDHLADRTVKAAPRSVQLPSDDISRAGLL